MPNMRRLAWVRRITGAHSQRGIATELGRSHTTIARWVREGITLSTILEICVVTGTDPYAAFDELGITTVAGLPRGSALQLVPTVRLTQELHRRAMIEATGEVGSAR
jgi:hypothetical protein